jgi:hypothetical protein
VSRKLRRVNERVCRPLAVSTIITIIEEGAKASAQHCDSTANGGCARWESGPTWA